MGGNQARVDSWQFGSLSPIHQGGPIMGALQHNVLIALVFGPGVDQEGSDGIMQTATSRMPQ